MRKHDFRTNLTGALAVAVVLTSVNLLSLRHSFGSANKTRSIASVETDGPATHSAILIPCESQSIAMDPVIESIRIEAEPCSGAGLPIKATHTASGHTATFFQSENGKITTDYFHLPPGNNSIIVEWRSGRKAELTLAPSVTEL